MLMQEFSTWLEAAPQDLEAHFKKFYKEKFNREVFNLNEIFEDIAWQVYNLQVCVEAMLEDSEV